MQRLSVPAVCLISVVIAHTSLNAATLESPKAGKTFKVGERVACAGKCGLADLAIVVAVKDKKGVIQQSAAAGVNGDTWTIVLDPPRSGWPPGEMTLEVISGAEAKKQASIKITFEK